MVNDLTTTDGESKEVAAARLHAIVENMYRSIERDRSGADTLPALPSHGLRKELTQRKRRLYAMLRPVSMAVGEQQRVREVIGALLGAYEVSLRLGNLKATAAGYVAHLGDQPLFAIIAAVEDFKHNRVYDIGKDGERVPFPLDRVPNAFRLLDQVKKHAADVQAEHYQIGCVLSVTRQSDAPSISPEEQEQVADGLRLLVSGLTKRVTAQQEADREKIRAQAQEARDRTARILADARRRNAEAYAESQDEQANG